MDHKDSFTWNLVQDLGAIASAVPEVVQSDALDIDAIAAKPPDLVVLGPGPGHPARVEDAARTPALVEAVAGRAPVFAVCFGMQILAVVLGGRVVRAREIVHGKSPPLRHDGRGIFEGLPSPAEMMRYHSLVVDRGSLPASLHVTAESEDGDVMALAHARQPVWGVQFHPESVGSPAGRPLLENVVRMAHAARGSKPLTA